MRTGNTIINDLKQVYEWLKYKLQNQTHNIIDVSRQKLETIHERIGLGLEKLESIQRDNANLVKEKRIVERNYNHLLNKYNYFVEQSKINSQDEQENPSLKNHIIKLQATIEQQRKQLEEMKAERGALLSELAHAQRNRETSYIVSPQPQNHLLVLEFRQLKDQNFHSVSNNIFRYQSEIDSSLKTNRKQQIASIKAILSNHIFIKGTAEIYTSIDNFSQDILNNAIIDISIILGKTLGLSDNSYILETFRNNIEALVKEGIKITHLKNLLETAEYIKTSIYSDLEIKADNIPDNLKHDIDILVQKGLELVKKIADADPPAKLILPEKGELFNCEQHEAMLGSDDNGKIEFPIFPAYVVRNRIFEKAVVITGIEYNSQ